MVFRQMAGFVAASTIAGLTGPAVSLPPHTAPTALRLIGASAQGVAVEQTGPPGNEWRSPLTGTEGGQLTRRSFGTYIDTSPMAFGVTGRSLAWGINQYSTDAEWDAHTMDLVTGRVVGFGWTGIPVGFLGDHWLSATPQPDDTTDPSGGSGPSQVDRNGPAMLHELTPTLARGGHAFSDRTIGTISSMQPFAAQGEWAVNARWDKASSVSSINLISLKDGTQQRVQDSTTPIESVAVGNGQIAWITRAPHQAPALHRRALTGGPITDWTDPNVPSSDTEAALPLVVGASGVAYLTSTRTRSVLRVAGDQGVRSVDLPPGSSGLASVGNRFLTAAGGKASQAGVYSVGANLRVSRTATVPPAEFTPSNPVLDTGRLYWTDRFGPSLRGIDLWSRRIIGGSPVRLGPEQRFRKVISRSPFEMAVSAGRTLALEPALKGSKVQITGFFDRGRQIAHVDVGAGSRSLSGPYAEINKTLYRADGTVLYRPARKHPIRQMKLFGPRFIYTRPTNDDRRSPDASIWTDDALTHHPRKLRDAQPQMCGNSPVAIWADTVAWVNCAQHTITVKNLRTGSSREIPLQQKEAWIDVQLSEGVLAWISDYRQGWVLDLTHPHAKPRAIKGTTEQMSVDDHWVARAVPTGDDVVPTAIRLQALPFQHPNRPRILGTIASPHIRAGDRWRPQFDATAPLSQVQMKITDAKGSTIRMLHGARADDGSIRDLRWDGRRSDGRRVKGRYTWTLTASGDDGRLVASHVNGRATTGTVTVL